MVPDSLSPPPYPGLCLALCCAALLVPVAARAHGAGEPTLAAWLGGLHPSAVHFPIAMLTGAALAELLLAVTGRESLGPAVRVMVWMGAAGAVVAAPLGWLAAQERVAEQGATQLLEWHRWLGTATAASSLGILVVNERVRGTRSGLRAALLAGALLVAATGYLGGELVHGDIDGDAHGGEHSASQRDEVAE